MCELFAVNSDREDEYNEQLKEFYSHSNHHPHGWGMAILEGTEAELIKEPLQASHSFYLHERLTVPVEGKVLLAHIRYATIGNIEYRNCHPFTGKDDSGRRWTMIHNGTIFHYPELKKYVKLQQGDTDSERIFLHLLSRMNRALHDGKVLNASERFRILDEIVSDMAEGNKLNLFIYDGEFLYVHTNQSETLYYHEEKGKTVFCTVPLRDGDWQPVPMTQLLAYQDGSLKRAGTEHGHSYVVNEKDMEYLYRIFANL